MEGRNCLKEDWKESWYDSEWKIKVHCCHEVHYLITSGSLLQVTSFKTEACFGYILFMDPWAKCSWCGWGQVLQTRSSLLSSFSVLTPLGSGRPQPGLKWVEGNHWVMPWFGGTLSSAPPSCFLYWSCLLRGNTAGDFCQWWHCNRLRAVWGHSVRVWCVWFVNDKFTGETKTVKLCSGWMCTAVSLTVPFWRMVLACLQFTQYLCQHT